MNFVSPIRWGCIRSCSRISRSVRFSSIELLSDSELVGRGSGSSTFPSIGTGETSWNLHGSAYFLVLWGFRYAWSIRKLQFFLLEGSQWRQWKRYLFTVGSIMEASSLSGMLKSLFLLNIFFCLGTQPSQFIEVLNIRVLRPYQHVKHWIKLTMRPGVTWMLLKFLVLVDTADWRRSSRQLVWFSLAFPLDSFSRTCSNSFSRSMLTTIVAGNRLKIPISIGYANQ